MNDPGRYELSESELANLIEYSRDAIIGKALDGTIRSWNPGAQALYGYTAEEAIGCSFDLLVPDDRREEMAAWNAELAAGRQVGPVDTVRRRKQGDLVPVSLTLAPLRGENGEIVGSATIARDLSEQMATVQALERALARQEGLENELRRRLTELAEADLRKDEFLATLAHELRNPLAPIVNGLELLRAEGDASQKARDIYDMIERQIRQLTRLVNDLLDLSRITRGKIKLQKDRVDLRRVAEHAVETVKPFLDNRGHELRLELSAEPVWVEGDALRLQQVLDNLLHNAGKFTPPEGVLTLEVYASGDEAHAVVTDRGVGMPAEVRDRVFDLFAQGARTLARSEGGLGIGLTTVQRLVELHAGRVIAESEGPGKGSRFTIVLPLVGQPQPTAARPAPAAPEPTGGQRGRRVLIIEDNRDAADALVELLGLWGHDAEVAYDGPEGLERAASFLPEVVLLDIGLPSMTGYEVAAALRQTEPGRRATVVALTGYGQESDVERALASGFDRHLLKPTDPSALRAIVEASDD